MRCFLIPEGVALVMHAFVLNLTPAYLASHPETTVMVDGLKLLVSGYMARPSAAALTVVKKIIGTLDRLIFLI